MVCSQRGRPQGVDSPMLGEAGRGVVMEGGHLKEPCPHLMAPLSTSPQYEKALLRGYVESCSNLTWCTNPQGCDRILCRQGLGCGTTCSKCGWASCFNCSFPEVGTCPALLPCSKGYTPPLPAPFSPYTYPPPTHTHTRTYALSDIHTYTHFLPLPLG